MQWLPLTLPVPYPFFSSSSIHYPTTNHQITPLLKISHTPLSHYILMLFCTGELVMLIVHPDGVKDTAAVTVKEPLAGEWEVFAS